MFRSTLAVALGVVLFASTSNAAIVNFKLEGKGGLGLIEANRNGGPIVGTPGSGGLIGSGIVYDTDTNVLTMEFGWGSGNGFTDLTGNATAMHIHGPADFFTNSGVQVNLGALPGYDNSLSNGGLVGSVNLSAAQETMLLDRDLYINVHTGANGGGEIRANLVAIPEPGSLLLLAAGSIGLLTVRRRR